MMRVWTKSVEYGKGRAIGGMLTRDMVDLKLSLRSRNFLTFQRQKLKEKNTEEVRLGSVKKYNGCPPFCLHARTELATPQGV